MSTYYTAQPEDLEPVEYTHFDCWEDGTTWEEIARAWSASLGITLAEGNQDETILDLLRKGYSVYEGDEFIEVYNGTTEAV